MKLTTKQESQTITTHDNDKKNNTWYVKHDQSKLYKEDELIEYIIRSLQGYLTKDGKDYFEKLTNIPADIPQSENDVYLTSRQIVGYIRDWRKAKSNEKANNYTLDNIDTQIHDLDTKVKRILGEITESKKDYENLLPVSNRPKKKKRTKAMVAQKKKVSYNMDIDKLPTVTSIFQYKDNENTHETESLVDTGATDNIINIDILKLLNVSTDQIKNKNRYLLNSATEQNSTLILGDIELTIFLQDRKGFFYPITETFCVIKNGIMTPIISIEFLRKYSFAWKTNIDPITRQPCKEILSLTIPINNSSKRKIL